MWARSPLDPLRADLVNTRGTGYLLEAARREGIRHFVYGSTIWVYGNAPGAEALDEDALLVPPDHFYTATKLAGEMYCRSYAAVRVVADHPAFRHSPRARRASVDGRRRASSRARSRASL